MRGLLTFYCPALRHCEHFHCHQCTTFKNDDDAALQLTDKFSTAGEYSNPLSTDAFADGDVEGSNSTSSEPCVLLATLERELRAKSEANQAMNAEITVLRQ